MNIKTTTIICEGLDCAGKSTIIRNIMSQVQTLRYYHFEFPQGVTSMEKYGFQRGQFDMMFKFIEMTQNESHFIFDRAHVGEYIWGPKYRDLYPAYMPELEHTYKDLPIVLLHVKCDPEVTRARFEKRKNEATPDLNYIKEYTKKFEIFCERSPFKTLTLDTTNLVDPTDITSAVTSLILSIEELYPKTITI